MKLSKMKKSFGIVLAFGLGITATPAFSEANFDGETLRIIVGFSPGGGYDYYGRLIARHLPNHLPGNPDVVVQNMPGAGSAVAANYMANRAESDGLTIGLLDGGNAILQLTDGEGRQFDLSEFQYMGGYSENQAVVVSTDLGTTDAEAVFNADEPVRFGHFGAGSFHTAYISIIADAMDSNAELVGGYGGGSEVIPAIERGEVQGTALTFGTLIRHIERGALAPVVMSGPVVDGLEDVPPAMEVAPTERGQIMLEVMNGVLEARRILVLPSDTDDGVVQALQDGFASMMQEPELLAEANQAGRPTNYITGQQARDIMVSAVSQPDEILDSFKDVLGR